jgi:hypothetical protein
MPSLSLSAKQSRVLQLLVGLSRNARARRALIAHGLTEAEYEEGWRLLRASATPIFDVAQLPAPNLDPGKLSALDAWENKWFPVIRATLGRRAPAVAGFVFHELSQAEGPAVILTVSTFLDRIQALEDGTQGTATLEGRDVALQAIVARGLDAAARAEARSLLQALGQLDTSEPPAPIDTEQAEAALWSWYLEWSQVSQSVIADRKALRALGFLRAARLGDDETEEVDEIVAVPGADGAAVAAPGGGAAPGAGALIGATRRKSGKNRKRGRR